MTLAIVVSIKISIPAKLMSTWGFAYKEFYWRGFLERILRTAKAQLLAEGSQGQYNSKGWKYARIQITETCVASKK